MMERLRENRWVYILISVLLAVVFWLYIRDTEDPTMSRPIYNVPIQIANERVLEERGLTVSGLSQNSLTVEVTGPVSVLNNLTRSNITASVDVSSITETGAHEVNCRLILPNNVDTTGAFFPEQSNPVTVTVDTLVTETMNVEVRLEGSVADGYQAGTPVADPETVELRGSAEQVSRVKRVAAILEADDLDQSFAGKLPLKLLDEDGEVLTDSSVKLSEDSAYVTMTVGVVKRVKLTVNLLPGGGATGEQAKCDISPSTITVVGSEEELEGLTEISLGSIDLSQVVDTATISKPIVLSPTLENADGVTEAQVTVVVEGLSTKTVTVTNIETVNQPDNYQVDVVTQERVVVIRGSESVLESLDASQIRIVADLSDVTATGTYPVAATVYLNASDEVGPVGTYTINVNVRKR
ncbi:MAG: hypothetical protein KH338_07570 [Oscillospiraceae bacterium]|nr:hypothetical protein [Oscillospiraceae bacterium]